MSGDHGDDTRAATAGSSRIVVRRVREDEYAAAGRTTLEAYLASYGDDITDDYAASLLDVAGRDRDGEVWVAVEAPDQAAAAADATARTAILGTVWIARDGQPLSAIAAPGETDFRQLAVAPDARGRGVGEALTRHVIEVARRRGSHRVVMNSGPQMTSAHALYTKLGFRRIAEREGPFEVEPGRWIELLTFGIDVPAD